MLISQPCVGNTSKLYMTSGKHRIAEYRHADHRGYTPDLHALHDSLCRGRVDNIWADLHGEAVDSHIPTVGTITPE